MSKPFSQACANNSQFICEKLQALLAKSHCVLEVGSGTGQHAVYFSRQLPHVLWQTSDLSQNHTGIIQWINDEGADNCLPPVELNVAQSDWSSVLTVRDKNIDAVFTANTLHIMSPLLVEKFFQGAGDILPESGLLMVYGPFKYDGHYTSDSNAQFDQWLKEADPSRGIRDIEWLDQLAAMHGLQRLHDFEMPANNRLQVWEKR